MPLNEKYWNDRYLNDQAGWDLGSASAPLKDFFDTLSNRSIRILIPGAGNAYEAEYLKQKGFEHVFVCDLADEPLRNLKRRCPAMRQDELIKGDFFNLPENEKYDLIVEQTFFCALDPSYRQQYFIKMHRLLRERGILAGLLFDCSFEVSPPFGGSADEYKGYFDRYFNVIRFEKCVNSIEPRKGRELFIELQRK